MPYTLSKLSSLIAFRERKNNVNLSIKEQVRRVTVTYNEVGGEIRGNNKDPTEKVEQVTQTSSKSKEVSNKNGRDITEELPKKSTKKRQKQVKITFSLQKENTNL